MAKRTQTRFIARMIEGSKPLAQMPGFISPQLATLRKEAPATKQWIHEIKFDGYRMQAHLEKGRTTMFTRGGLDWTRKFANIANAFDIPVERAIFDGEVVVIEEGRTNFSSLQAAISENRQDRMAFYVFDILYLEGFDLRDSPLIERKRVLAMLFEETGLMNPVFYSEHFETNGPDMFKTACQMKLEGIISKNVAAPYRSTRSEAWLKVKCAQIGKFTIVGYTLQDSGVLAALHLAQRQGKDLIYAGKVGTGFSQKTASDVKKQLTPLVVPKSMLAKTPRVKAFWIEPKLTASVEYRDITAEGLLRHASFKGLGTARK